MINLKIQILFFRATESLKQCGPSVTLQILKNAANHHGFSSLFPSPSNNHHQSNPNLFRSKQNFNRNLFKTQSLILREDIPLKPMINETYLHKDPVYISLQ